MNKKILKNRQGAGMLLTVLIIGAIIIEIGIADVFMVLYSGQGVFGVRFSAEALSAAKAGIDDGKLKVVRNKDLNYATSGSPYTINVGNRSSEIRICQDSAFDGSSCTGSFPGKTEITSIGTAFNRKRKIRAVLNVNSETGEVKTELIEEVAL